MGSSLDAACSSCYPYNNVEERMSQPFIATEVNAQGEVRLPRSVRQALHLSAKGGTIGFFIEAGRVVVTKATVVPDAPLSTEELAFLARLSKRGVGTRTFRTTQGALRYLWSL
jgi:hypothetical protein